VEIDEYLLHDGNEIHSFSGQIVSLSNVRSHNGMSPLIAIILLLLEISSPLIAQPDDKMELTVFAAASLTEAFQALGRTFEAAHPPVKIRFNFGGSQQLVLQIIQGAKADIFAPANMKQMNTAVSSGLVDTNLLKIFARNKLVVILPKDNPGHLGRLTDLAKPNIKLVLADSSVPVGQYALRVLERCSETKDFGTSFKEDALRNVVSYEENVRAVLSKVKLGECDAGIVYSSDITRDSLHEVIRIDIPDQLNIIAEYPIAITNQSESRQTAGEFLDYVLSDEGGRVLSTFGFIR
jgi:molybdate transport system substrate-binding protein